MLMSPQTAAESAALDALEQRFKLEYQLQSSDPTVRGNALKGLAQLELGTGSPPAVVEAEVVEMPDAVDVIDHVDRLSFENLVLKRALRERGMSHHAIQRLLQDAHANR